MDEKWTKIKNGRKKEKNGRSKKVKNRKIAVLGWVLTLWIHLMRAISKWKC